MNSKRSASTGPSSTPTEPSLPQIPKYPNLGQFVDPVTFELVEKEQPRKTSGPPGLFDSFMSRHVDVLLQDVLDHPDKYDPALLEVLVDLHEGRIKREGLTRTTQELLDRATLDFATYVPPKKESKRGPHLEEMKTASVEDFDELGYPDAEDFPTEPSSYWWAK